MNIALWSVQGLLALLFGFSGGVKLLRPYHAVGGLMPVMRDLSPRVVKLIGGLEVLGAAGLLAPMLTGVVPWLTPLAATGLALTMVGASIAHGRRKEYNQIGITSVILLLAVFVVYGRFALFAA